MASYCERGKKPPSGSEKYAGRWEFVTGHFGGSKMRVNITVKGDTMYGKSRSLPEEFTFKGHVNMHGLMNGKYNYKAHNAVDKTITIQFKNNSIDEGVARFWQPYVEEQEVCSFVRVKQEN